MILLRLRPIQAYYFFVILSRAPGRSVDCRGVRLYSVMFSESSVSYHDFPGFDCVEPQGSWYHGARSGELRKQLLGELNESYTCTVCMIAVSSVVYVRRF
jgi:hypothetical protein